MTLVKNVMRDSYEEKLNKGCQRHAHDPVLTPDNGDFGVPVHFAECGISFCTVVRFLRREQKGLLPTF
jgi:hypothetical protein